MPEFILAYISSKTLLCSALASFPKTKEDGSGPPVFKF